MTTSAERPRVLEVRGPGQGGNGSACAIFDSTRAFYDTRPPAEVIAELKPTGGTDMLAAVMGLLMGSWWASSRLSRYHELVDAFERWSCPGWPRGSRWGGSAVCEEGGTTVEDSRTDASSPGYGLGVAGDDEQISPWFGAPANFLSLFAALFLGSVMRDLGWRWFAYLPTAVIGGAVVSSIALALEVR